MTVAPIKLKMIVAEPLKPGELSPATRWLVGRKVYELINATRIGGAEYLRGVAERYTVAAVELAASDEHEDIAAILTLYSRIARHNADRVAAGLLPLNPAPHLKIVEEAA